MTMRKLTNESKQHLRLNINKLFDLPDFQGVCFALGIDYDNLAGATKDAKAQSLISGLERQGQVDELLQFLQGQRPLGSWNVDFVEESAENLTIGFDSPAEQVSSSSEKRFTLFVASPPKKEYLRNKLWPMFQNLDIEIVDSETIFKANRNDNQKAYIALAEAINRSALIAVCLSKQRIEHLENEVFQLLTSWKKNPIFLRFEKIQIPEKYKNFVQHGVFDLDDEWDIGRLNDIISNIADQRGLKVRRIESTGEKRWLRRIVPAKVTRERLLRITQVFVGLIALTIAFVLAIQILLILDDAKKSPRVTVTPSVRLTQTTHALTSTFDLEQPSFR